MLRQKALFQDNSNLATSFWTTISVVTTYWKKENNGYQAAIMKTKKSMNLSEDNTTKQTVVRRCIYREKRMVNLLINSWFSTKYQRIN